MSWPFGKPLPRPRAGVLLVGSELTSGDVVDLNGPHLLVELRRRGVEVCELRVVGDDVARIADAVRSMRQQADALFVAGGIGPTHDDVTLEAIAQALDAPLYVHPELLARIRAHFGEPLLEGAARLARVPQGAACRFGSLALLPALTVQNVAILPGVPRLMRACLATLLGQGALGPAFVRRDLRLVAQEPDLVAPLAQLQAAHAEVTLGCYPNFEVRPFEVRLSVQGRDQAAVDRAVEALRDTWPLAELLLAP